MNKKLLLAPLLFVAGTALAQQSPDLFMEFNNQTVGPVYSADQQNLQSSQSVSLMCVFNMTSHTGNARVEYMIQGRVPNSGDGVYFKLLDSLQVEADNTPIVLIMGPGIENAPQLNKALPVPRIWRIVVLISGAKSGETQPARSGGSRTDTPAPPPIETPVSVNGNLSCRVQ